MILLKKKLEFKELLADFADFRRFQFKLGRHAERSRRIYY